MSFNFTSTIRKRTHHGQTALNFAATKFQQRTRFAATFYTHISTKYHWLTLLWKTLLLSFNTLKPRQNGCHFSEDIFECIILNENVWISTRISLKFVPKSPIDNIPALVQIRAWHWQDDKPLSESMMARLVIHICATSPQWVNSWE